MELGTKLYPYKKLNPALIELFNLLPSSTSKAFNVLIRENTTNYLPTLFQQQIILNAMNLWIRYNF